MDARRRRASTSVAVASALLRQARGQPVTSASEQPAVRPSASSYENGNLANPGGAARARRSRPWGSIAVASTRPRDPARRGTGASAVQRELPWRALLRRGRLRRHPMAQPAAAAGHQRAVLRGRSRRTRRARGTAPTTYRPYKGYSDIQTGPSDARLQLPRPAVFLSKRRGRPHLHV